MLFGIDEEKLKSTNSYNTPKEILQQPRLWKETIEIFKKSEKKVKRIF